MVRVSIRFIGTLFGIILGLTLLNRFVLHDVFSNLAMKLISRPAAYVYDRSSAVRSIAREYAHVRALTKENEQLRKENESLLARIGYEQTLEKENQFLRASLKIPQRVGQIETEAGVFMQLVGASGYEMLLNKGRTRGVSQGDIVVTGDGILVGRIQEAFPSYARIQLVSDPGIEVAARVLGKDTRGIAQGGLTEGMSLKLIVQEEAVTEGDTIISSGHDAYPPGLVLGRVAHVESNESEVFKKIRIQEAAASSLLGQVFVVHTQ